MGLGLTSLILLGQFLPFGVAFASPSEISRPGAGVSRIPLEVMAFNAPGFGDISDAINLANGNVYLDVGELSRNTKVDTPQDNKNTVLNANWNLKNRTRLLDSALGDFKPSWTLGSLSGEVILEQGDGSTQRFSQVQDSSLPVDAPSWIKARYAAVISAQQSSGIQTVAFYRVRPMVGTRHSEEWIVFVKGLDGLYGHHYDHNGNRTTFHNDGAFPDYVQNPSQQYRTAKLTGTDVSEGLSGGLKTEINYQDKTAGRISEIKDEFGRITSYWWVDAGVNGWVLGQIDYKNDGTLINKQTTFSYGAQAGLYLLKGVGFKTWDGKGTAFSLNSTRNFTLHYSNAQSFGSEKPVLLKAITREVVNTTGDKNTPSSWVNGSKLLTTSYTYGAVNLNGKASYALTESRDLVDASIDATTAAVTGGTDVQPKTTYGYTDADPLYKGLKVVVSQGDQETQYYYDKGSRLRERWVKDVQAASNARLTAVNRYLKWSYDYYLNGNLALEVNPDATGEALGKTIHYAYDGRGNVVRKDTFASKQFFIDDKIPLRLNLTADKGYYRPGDLAVFSGVLEGADPTKSSLTWTIDAPSLVAVTMPGVDNFTEASNWSALYTRDLVTGASTTPMVRANVFAGSTASAVRVQGLSVRWQSDPLMPEVLRRTLLSPGSYTLTVKVKKNDSRTGSVLVRIPGQTDQIFTLESSWKTLNIPFTVNETTSGDLGLIATGTGDFEFDALSVAPAVLQASSQNYDPAKSLTDSSAWTSRNAAEYPAHRVFNVPSTDNANGYSGLISHSYFFSQGCLGACRVRFWARTVSGTLPINYGINDYASTSGTLTTSWKYFDTTFNVGSMNYWDNNFSRQFQIFEQTSGNPAWQIAGVMVNQVDGNNNPVSGIVDSDLTGPDSGLWGGYFLKPAVMVQDPTSNGYTVFKSDSSTDNVTGGLTLKQKLPVGRYQVSFDAKADSALDIYSGMSDAALQKSSLTSSWQTVSTTLVVSNDTDRFTLLEKTTNNPGWYVRNLKLNYLDGKLVQIPRGVPSFQLTVKAKSDSYPDVVNEVSLPVYSYIKSVAAPAPEGDLPLSAVTTGTKPTSVRYQIPLPASANNPYNKGYQVKAHLNLDSAATSSDVFSKKIRWYTNGGSIAKTSDNDETITFTPPAWSKDLSGSTQQYTLVAVSEENPSVYDVIPVEVRYFGFDFYDFPNSGIYPSTIYLCYPWDCGTPNDPNKKRNFQFKIEMKNLPTSADGKFWYPIMGLGWKDSGSTQYTWFGLSQTTAESKIDIDGCMAVRYFDMRPIGAQSSIESSIAVGLNNNRDIKIERPLTMKIGGQELACTFNDSGIPKNNGVFKVNGGLIPTDEALQGTKDWQAVVQAAMGTQSSSDPGILNVANQILSVRNGIANLKFAPMALTATQSAEDQQIILPEGVSAEVLGEFNPAERKGWTSQENFVYNNDNQLVQSQRPAITSSYLYGNTTSPYTPSYPALGTVNQYSLGTAVLVNNQSFNVVAQVDAAILKGASFDAKVIPASIASVGGTELRRTVLTYDQSGRRGLLATQGVKWNDQNGVAHQTTATYTYRAASDATVTTGQLLYYRDVNNTTTAGAPTVTRTVKQPQDQPSQVITRDLAGNTLSNQYLHYDEFGNVVRDELVGAVAGNLPSSVTADPSSVTRSNYQTRMVYNGFGQKVWSTELLGSYQNEQVNNYASSGELLSNWSGHVSNLTDYHFSNGMLTGVARGLGPNTAWSAQSPISTLRSLETYELDSFGRVSKEHRLVLEGGTLKNDFVISHSYDSLGRELSGSNPDGSGMAQTYDAFGGVDKQTKLDPKGEVELLQTYARNHLGWVTRESKTTYATSTLAGTNVNTGTFNTDHVYDQLGLEIVTLSYDASIVSDNDSRRMVKRYDVEGNLLYTVSPVMRNVSSNSVTDNRRSVVSSTYDNLGQVIKQRVLLESDTTVNWADPLVRVSDGSLVGDVATTTTEYNDLGQAVKVTDAEGYVTTTDYDLLNNAYRVKKSLWNAKEPTSTSDPLSSRSITLDKTQTDAVVWSAFDAAKNVVGQMNNDGKVRKLYYNPLNQVYAESEWYDPASAAGGVISKFSSITADGMVVGTYLPKVTGTPATTGTASWTSSIGMYFDQVESFQFNYSLPLPSKSGKPSANLVSGTPTWVWTSFEYNHQGKPVKTTLPTGGVLTQAYDEDGNTTEQVNAEGFKTTFKYNPFGQVLERKELARTTTTSGTTTTNSVDSAAGLSGGFTYTYKYDWYGNLTRKSERNLYTYYEYNSLGKMTAESRPAVFSATGVPWKKHLYRLDGNKVMETSYAYTDSNPSFLTLTPVQKLTVNAGSPTAGNLKIWELDGLGRVSKEISKGVGYDPNGAADPINLYFAEEYFAQFVYNSLNARVYRYFRGNPQIYAQQTKDDGTQLLDASGKPETRYGTYWKYNTLGLLKEKYDEVLAAGQVLKKNTFTYEYDAQGRETRGDRNLKINVENPAKIGSTTLAATLGAIVTEYNNRGLVQKTTITDQSVTHNNTLEATPLTQVTENEYYLDGNRSKVTVTSGGTSNFQTFKYDTLGREIESKDSNGARYFIKPEDVNAQNFNVLAASAAQPLVITTAYGLDATQTVSMYSAVTGCTFTEKTTQTLSGLNYSTVKTKDACGVVTSTLDQLGIGKVGNPSLGDDDLSKRASKVFGPTAYASSVVWKNGEAMFANLQLNKAWKYNTTLTNKYNAYGQSVSLVKTDSRTAEVSDTQNSYKTEFVSNGDLVSQTSQTMDCTADGLGGAECSPGESKRTYVPNTGQQSGTTPDPFPTEGDFTATYTTIGAPFNLYSLTYLVKGTYGNSTTNTVGYTYDANYQNLTSTSSSFSTSEIAPTKTQVGSPTRTTDISIMNRGEVSFTAASAPMVMKTSDNKPAENFSGVIVTTGVWTGSAPSGQTTVTNYVYTPTDGHLFREETPQPNDATVTFYKQYSLDSRGNRILFTSKDGNIFKNYGYLKRYDADQKVALFYKVEADKHNWNHFLYSPTGDEVLSSTAGVRQLPTDGTSTKYSTLVERKWNSSYSTGLTIQMVRHKEGSYTATIDRSTLASTNGSGTYDPANADYLKQPDKYDQVRDATFSLADGVNSSTEWTGVVVFDAPDTQADTEAAEVLPESITGTVAPLDVQSHDQVDPIPSPGDVKPSGAKDTTKAKTPQKPTAETPAEGQTQKTSDKKDGISSPEITTFSQGTSTQVVQGKAVSPQAAEEKTPGSAPAPTVHIDATGQITVSDTTVKSDGDQAENSSVLPGSIEGVTLNEVQTHGADSGAPIQDLNPGGVAGVEPAPPSVGVTTSDSPGDVVSSEGTEPATPDTGHAPRSTSIKPSSNTVETMAGPAAYLCTVKGCIAKQDLEKAKNDIEQRVADLAARDDEIGKAMRRYQQLIEDRIRGNINISVYGRLYAYEAALAIIDSPKMQSDTKAIFLNSIADSVEKGYLKAFDFIHGHDELAKIIKNGASPDQIARHMISYYADKEFENQLKIINAQTTMKIVDDLLGITTLQECRFGDKLACGLAAASVVPWGEAAGPLVRTLGKYLPEEATAAASAFGSKIKGWLDTDVGELFRGAAKACGNSFDPETLVKTASGDKAIASLMVGEKVLAFNEETGKEEYQPISQIFKNEDPALTVLGISDPESGQMEFITTTPEHPFYVTERSDGEPRPKPEGHSDLSDKWVGAGHLKVGDKLKQADGTLGEVRYVNIIEQARTMYNLEVAEAHTFFVGAQGWLVHNGKKRCEISFQGTTVGASDAISKGFHLNYGNGELNLVPTRVTVRDAKGKVVNEYIEIQLKSTFSKKKSAVEVDGKVAASVEEFIRENMKKAAKGAEAIIGNWSDVPSMAQRVAEAKLLMEAFTGQTQFKVVP
ncbi:hypothetical protein GCM10008938_19280 [Deinococcus roseus]|uniref:Hint domain-containing protein n=2 Tax=Deinococcus roseus TaxID=392414 RepID=A0ABQ2CZ05_9DEIO|nr:hypothetical protein GCM10008938_19280 [Deinococcus roseus]